MNQLLTEESGAASVLIIFMMLVLVTLGAYSISSARINYVFSRKSLEWNQKYYVCDTQAERFLMNVDSALAESERKTAEAALGRGTHEVQNIIGSITLENAEDILNRLYRSYVVGELQSVSELYPDMEVHEEGQVISLMISEDSSALDLKIAVLPFRYSFESADGGIKGILENSHSRYMVLEWRQSQKAVGDDVVRPLWDGIVE